MTSNVSVSCTDYVTSSKQIQDNIKIRSNNVRNCVRKWQNFCKPIQKISRKTWKLGQCVVAVINGQEFKLCLDAIPARPSFAFAQLHGSNEVCSSPCC